MTSDVTPAPAAPGFFPQGQRGLNRIVAQWADHQLFWAAMGYNFQPKGLAQVFEGVPAEAVKAFGADRQGCPIKIFDGIDCQKR